ncbi:DUF1553 domain-containing protein [Blastopirellula marina]|uniref:LamG-like jellyroll fold domain-containing protein n=1 Tax=Blastopirellula marina TaxID=124 RepID=A0A2S8F3Q8_9BACT|nr:DUF1553 domain-containing protein [Blastopirellula marina]PQO26802.1 hypothetical protein C5Y98_28945 [Blastopirellula marina]PTL41009.1 DUF1553 domain-containing protein [Blastopirellula marina]
MKLPLFQLALIALSACGTPYVLADGSESLRPDFAADVLPILTQRCFACHGPDEKQRQADLRLDRAADFFQRHGDEPAIVKPGDAADSELYRRLVASDPDVQMPPPEHGGPLALDEITTIKRWIDTGAKWRGHWAFQPIVSPKLPQPYPGWSEQPIDRLVAAQWPEQSLTPAEPADREMLLRRVTFALTGLPPTDAEIQAFLADQRPDAYERVVDRLLASSRYGEQMARQWLDLARYADTHGFNIDSYRDMWRWRDWVIDAYNANMPYDQFTIEQLAGDLLPDATVDQITATGFNRNHPINDEMGAIPEEYLHFYAADRTNTTATVWLGLTLACAECHDHKYDPISQRDYYQFYAFFNNVDDLGLDGRRGNAAPIIVSPTRTQRDQQSQLDQQLAALDTELAAARRQAAADLAAWESSDERDVAASQPPADSAARFALDGDSDAVKIKRENDEPPLFLPGKFDQALLCDGRTSVASRQPLKLGDSFSIGLWIYPTTSSEVVLVAAPQFTLSLDHGELVYETLERRLHTTEVAKKNLWQQITLTVDGKSVALYRDGEALPLTVGERIDTMETAEMPPQVTQLQIARAGESGGFRGLLDDVRVYARALNPLEAQRLGGGDPIGEILAKPADQRSPAEQATLLDDYLRKHDPQYAKQIEQHDAFARQRRRLVESFPETMVMRERAERRPARVLQRGRYDLPGEVVTPDVLDCLPPLPNKTEADRLALAEWLVDPRQPLTARVAVNRYWQMLFGTSLVATPEDFGLRSAPPTNPELLDYLAADFRDHGWDVKRLIKSIVMSAAYQQTSAVPAAKWEADPANVYFARGPRLRLTAEQLRDASLAASGLLNEQIGGPSVFPYQPAGLWEAIAYGRDFTAQKYAQDYGDRLYRRSLYTFWKRSSPPPNMSAFDAPNREFCTLSRSRTNTPQQALVLMNDPTFVEAARVMAAKLMQANDTVDAQITAAFLELVSRQPSEHELPILRQLYQSQLARYQQDAAAAKELVAIGEAPAADVPIVQQAALTMVVSTIMNLDEAIHAN